MRLAPQCGPPPSGARLNHRAKVTFNRMTSIRMSATSPEPRVPTEEIAGLVERVTFFNPESGFAVLRVQVRGQREPVTILGSLPSVSAGEWLTAEGWWVRDK
jgi:hypothetical protein